MTVNVLTPDGSAIAEKIMVKVPALKDTVTGEVLAIMDKAIPLSVGYTSSSLRSLRSLRLCERLFFAKAATTLCA